jgi:arylsulfatase
MDVHWPVLTCFRSTTARSSGYPALAGRPDLMAGRTSLTLYPGMDGTLENTFINVKNTSMSIAADIDVPGGGADGVIIAQGGRFGGGLCTWTRGGRSTL